jgi:hypothetical protein
VTVHGPAPPLFHGRHARAIDLRLFAAGDAQDVRDSLELVDGVEFDRDPAPASPLPGVDGNPRSQVPSELAFEIDNVGGLALRGRLRAGIVGQVHPHKPLDFADVKPPCQGAVGQLAA